MGPLKWTVRLTDFLYRPPMNLREGNVFSRALDLIVQGDTMYPVLATRCHWQWGVPCTMRSYVWGGVPCSEVPCLGVSLYSDVPCPTVQPPPQCWHLMATGGKQAVRILLECFVEYSSLTFYFQRYCIFSLLSFKIKGTKNKINCLFCSSFQNQFY